MAEQALTSSPPTSAEALRRVEPHPEEPDQPLREDAPAAPASAHSITPPQPETDVPRPKTKKKTVKKTKTAAQKKPQDVQFHRFEYVPPSQCVLTRSEFSDGMSTPRDSQADRPAPHNVVDTAVETLPNPPEPTPSVPSGETAEQPHAEGHNEPQHPPAPKDSPQAHPPKQPAQQATDSGCVIL